MLKKVKKFGVFMKKIVFFCLFLLTIAISIPAMPQKASADIAGYSISFSAKIYNDSTGQYLDASGFNSATSVFTADYSDFLGNSSITFTGKEVPSDQNPSSKTFVYKWQSATGKVVSHSANLTLYKTSNWFDTQLISFGETRYKLTITDEQGNTLEKAISVRITDNLNACKLFTYDPIIPAEVNSLSEPLEFSAKLPIVNGTSINWYVKKPNSANYILAETNKEQFVFDPAVMVNNQNGFGEYQVLAIAQNKNTKKYYYSKTYFINAVEKATSINQEEYKIISKVINNTKAKIEAFKYSIQNSENLNVENIYWYLNDVRVATGETFTYEPTTTDVYKIIAKYKKSDNAIVEIGTHRETPNATGTLELILVLLACGVVLSAIFATSIIVTNKKRDVIW